MPSRSDGAFTFDWTKFFPRAAARCVLAMAALIAAGIGSGHALQGMEAAAGAFSVGFGSFHELHKSRIAPLLYASAGMCLSSWVGTVAGNSTLAVILAATLGGIAYAMVAALSPAISYVGLQCVVWLVISSAYPATGVHALQRGLLVLGGGLLQTATISTLWRVERNVTPLAPGSGQDDADPLRHLRQALATDRQIALYMLRAALTLLFSATLWRWRQSADGYWIPMTAVVVLRPNFRQTTQRTMARIIGTLAGAAVSTLLVALLRPGPWVVTALIVLFSWLAYSLLYVNYSAYAACLTAYVVFLVTFAGLPGLEVIRLRTVNTAMGGLIALGLMLIFGVLHRDATAEVR